MFPSANLRSISLSLLSSNAREEMMLLWCETHAPRRLPIGRLRKYLSDWAADIFSARPLITTCRSSSYHGKQSVTWGLFSICAAFLLS